MEGRKEEEREGDKERRSRGRRADCVSCCREFREEEFQGPPNSGGPQILHVAAPKYSLRSLFLNVFLIRLLLNIVDVLL